MTLTLIEHRYRPRGTARAILENRAPEILVSGPAGTGKSRACLEKLHAAAKKYPGMRALIVRKTLASLGSTALVTWRAHVITKDLQTGEVAFYGGSPQDAPQYRYANGSVISIGGMDKATRIMSSEYDMVYVQEAVELTEEDWEAITTRLRNGVMPYQQLLADCNPDAPTHWLKARCDRGSAVMLHSRHEENPVLFGDDGEPTEVGRSYISKLDRLTGVRYHRLRYGRWVAAEGVIFEEWEPAVHLVDWFQPPDNWRRFWSIDWGFTNPFVCQMWAEDPDGRLYLYRELYRTKRTVDQHAQDILNTVAVEDPQNPGRWIWKDRKPYLVLADHDAGDRATFEAKIGIGTVPAVKGVADGIQAVQARMRPAADGKPRLFVMRDTVVHRDQDLIDAKRPTCTAEEIPGYVWEKPGVSSKVQAPKEVPLKENDHGCDALRYLCFDRELGTPRIRMM